LNKGVGKTTEGTEGKWWTRLNSDFMRRTNRKENLPVKTGFKRQTRKKRRRKEHTMN